MGGLWRGAKVLHTKRKRDCHLEHDQMKQRMKINGTYFFREQKMSSCQPRTNNQSARHYKYVIFIIKFAYMTWYQVTIDRIQSLRC